MNTAKLLKVAVMVVVGLAFAGLGIYVGETDDAPGAALIGFVILIATLVLACRTALKS
jgi:hypothetical protein